METRAHHVLIGLFTVLVMVAAVLFALWLADPRGERDYQYFVIGFDRPVSGLSNGSRVEYSGIPVGEVRSLSLHQSDPRRVRALVRVDEGTPVNEHTRARLALANITGAMKIQLFGGTPESQRIDGDIDDPPLIVAEPSSFGSMMESSEGLMASISELLVSANEVLSEQNVQRVTRTLENLEKATSVLAEQRDDISIALSELAQMSSETTEALREVTRLARDTNASLNHEQRGLFSRAEESMAALERTSKRLEQLLADNEGAVDSGLRGLGDLGPALHELRSTLTTLNRITRRLEANPGDFIFGREEIREFDP